MTAGRAVSKDVALLRDLARQVAGIAADPEQDRRRDLWRRHNSLEAGQPPIYIRGGSCWGEILDPLLECEDPFWRRHERFLRHMIFQAGIGDDYVIEPWITQPATRILPQKGAWGLALGRIDSPEAHGAWKCDPPIKDLDDVRKMVTPSHRIDEGDTARSVERLREAVGDILPVNVDRGPHYQVWAGDIATQLAHLRGLEQIMWDMVDEPEWLHELLAFMRDGILKTHEEAEAAGDWQRANHQNQSMPYARELADPVANSGPVRRKELWCFLAAQELTLVSPQMHEEFMLRYQAPILAPFGLVAYGCCEDLSEKIDMLRTLPNLRRIAVAPRADIRRCAEQIGGDYVCSYRPNPAEMVCCGFDENRIRETLARDLAVFRDHGCIVDICLKDVQTVEKDASRLRRFTDIARQVTETY